MHYIILLYNRFNNAILAHAQRTGNGGDFNIIVRERNVHQVNKVCGGVSTRPASHGRDVGMFKKRCAVKTLLMKYLPSFRRRYKGCRHLVVFDARTHTHTYTHGSELGGIVAWRRAAAGERNVNTPRSFYRVDHTETPQPQPPPPSATT